jgi:ubiquinone/menaquinone biosynthesis C-methylase UbiE
MDAVKFWDGIAPKYAKTPISDQESYAYTLERTASYLKASDHVLELGCGTGSTALQLAGHADHITASDFSEAMLEEGRRKAAAEGVQNVSFIQAGAHAPPEGPFDVVMAFNLLHLVDDLDDALAAARAVLKPGGLLISKTFCKPEQGASLKFRAMRMALPVMQWLGKVPYVRFITAADLDRQVEAAGFTLVERESYPKKDARRYLVARRVD